MKKKLKKQKFRLFLGITLSMFLLSIIVFITIAINILNTEKEKLEADTFAEFSNIADNVTHWSESLYSSSDTDYFINDKQITGDSDRAHIRVSDVTDTNNTADNIIAETRNTISVDFYDEAKISYFGTIDFDVFRNMLTAEEYETICEYLSKEANENGEYYDLQTWIAEQPNDQYLWDLYFADYGLEDTYNTADILLFEAIGLMSYFEEYGVTGIEMLDSTDYEVSHITSSYIIKLESNGDSFIAIFDEENNLLNIIPENEEWNGYICSFGW